MLLNFVNPKKVHSPPPHSDLRTTHCESRLHPHPSSPLVILPFELRTEEREPVNLNTDQG